MSNPTCQCSSLNDLAVIDMGEHDDVFATLIEVSKRGEPWWWLRLSKCTACSQHWLIAQEERHNDVFILRRLPEAVAIGVLTENKWPDEFDKYGTLLEIGRRAGKRVTFLSPEDSTLQLTVEDLAREAPGIRVSRLALLLNLDFELAAHLAHVAVNRAGVDISFDVS